MKDPVTRVALEAMRSILVTTMSVTPVKAEIEMRYSAMFSRLDVESLQVSMVRIFHCGLVLLGEYFSICVPKTRNLRRNDML